MKYELIINYKAGTSIVITTEGKHAVAGFVLDALSEHESCKFELGEIRLAPITNSKPPVSLDFRINDDK